MTDPGREPGRFLALLDRRVRATRTVLCLGVDPDPGTIPGAFGTGLAGIVRSSRALLDAALPAAAAVKFNLAFFEACGSAGLAALERLRAMVPPDVPVVADAKRGDVASTARRQAVALFDVLGADAVTLSPFLGRDALEPFLDRPDRFSYVLCRTSNPSAAAVQALRVAAADHEPEEPLYERIARLTGTWDDGTRLGLVVGATDPLALGRVRAVAPSLPFLVPGLGAQGGAIGPALAAGPASAGPAGAMAGGALLVNVSRGIATGGLDADDPVEGMAAAARAWAARLAPEAIAAGV